MTWRRYFNACLKAYFRRVSKKNLRNKIIFEAKNSLKRFLGPLKHEKAEKKKDPPLKGNTEKYKSSHFSGPFAYFFGSFFRIFGGHPRVGDFVNHFRNFSYVWDSGVFGSVPHPRGRGS